MHTAVYTATDGTQTEVLVVGFIRREAPNEVIANHPGWTSFGAVIVVDGAYEVVAAHRLRPIIPGPDVLSG